MAKNLVSIKEDGTMKVKIESESEDRKNCDKCNEKKTWFHVRFDDISKWEEKNWENKLDDALNSWLWWLW